MKKPLLLQSQVPSQDVVAKEFVGIFGIMKDSMGMIRYAPIQVIGVGSGEWALGTSETPSTVAGANLFVVGKQNMVPPPVTTRLIVKSLVIAMLSEAALTGAVTVTGETAAGANAETVIYVMAPGSTTINIVDQPNVKLKAGNGIYVTTSNVDNGYIVVRYLEVPL